MNLQHALDQATIDGLFAIADGDEAFVRDLLACYVTQAREQLDAIQVAMANDDRRAVWRAAHALAGASLNVGAFGVARVCRQIEVSTSVTAADVRELERELSGVCDEPPV